MLPVSVVFLSMPSAEAAGSRKVCPCSLILRRGLKEGTGWWPTLDMAELARSELADEPPREPWLAERRATRGCSWLIVNDGDFMTSSSGESEGDGTTQRERLLKYVEGEVTTMI